MRYMTKPVFVDAVRWHRLGDHPKVIRFAEFQEDADPEKADQPVLETPLGLVAVSPGDWVVKDDKGNIYVIQDSDFVEQFEKVVYGA